MNYSTYRASLDIHASGSQAVLHAKKGETKRRILITLTERGKPYLISSDCTAVFTATKPDGNIIYNDCAIDNNIICYNFTEQTTAAEGKLDCEIRLYGADNALIISPGFDLIVDAAVYEDGAVIESGTEVSALTALVSETNTLIRTVNTKLENGEFNGPAGEAGGWYTPEIKQPIKGAMVVNFTPSKEGMPAAPGKNIILPQGETGETGGYYTPAVTQPDENTLRVAFTPSKEDMPAVADTDITLPAGGGGGGSGSGADGKSAYAYAVEGGYTGTEEEFAAKLAQEKFANPNALTFTGAVTGSYDGSEAVTVEIPSGGGGGFEVLVDFTTEQAVTEFTIPKTVIGPLASKLNEAPAVFIQLIVPRDTSDETITTTGSVTIKGYVGWLTDIAGGAFNCIAPPSNTYNTQWSKNLFFTKVPSSANKSAKKINLVNIVGGKSNENIDALIQRSCDDYFPNFNANSYITVTGSQTMAAGTRFIMGVIA